MLSQEETQISLLLLCCPRNYLFILSNWSLLQQKDEAWFIWCELMATMNYLKCKCSSPLFQFQIHGTGRVAVDLCSCFAERVAHKIRYEEIINFGVILRHEYLPLFMISVLLPGI